MLCGCREHEHGNQVFVLQTRLLFSKEYSPGVYIVVIKHTKASNKQIPKQIMWETSGRTIYVKLSRLLKKIIVYT